MNNFKDEKEQAVWSLDISNKPKFVIFALRELYQYRYLLGLFVYRDLVTTYKQTILGPAWILLKPLLTTFAFVAAFSGILGVSTDSTPPVLFYLSGIICWGLFAEIFTMTSTVFIDSASIFSKVYFPRLIRPLSLVLASFVRVAIQLLVLAAVLLFHVYFGNIQPPGVAIVLVFPILICIALLGLGLGLLFSSVTSKYRDLKHLVHFGIQLLMYITPVIYPISQVPESFRKLMFANPLSAPIEAFRSVVLGVDFPTVSMLAYSWILVVLFILTGILAFHKTEARAMDTI